MSKKNGYVTLRIKGGSKVALKTTSKLPKAEVVKAVRHALAHLDVDKTAVHVKNFGSGGAVGRAYYDIPGMASAEIPWWCHHLIVIRENSLTGIVGTTAHEGKHIDEYRGGRHRKNKRERSTERKARTEDARKSESWLKLQREQG